MAAAFRKSCQDAQPELDEIAAELSNTLSHPISITIDWDSMEPDLDDHWKANAGSTVVGWFRGAMRELLGFFDEPLGIARDAFVGLVPSGRIVVRGISRDVPGNDVNYDVVGGTGSGVEPTGCFLISKRNNYFSYSMSEIDKGLHRNTMWTHYVKLLINIHEKFVPYKREVEAELSELFGEPFYINTAVQSMLEYASDEDGAAFDEDNQKYHGGLMVDKLKNIRDQIFDMMEEHQPTREIFLQCCPGRVINMLWDEPHEHKTYWDTFHTATARAVFQMEKVAPIEQLSQVQRYLDGADFPPLNLTGACNVYLNPKYRTFTVSDFGRHIDEQMEDSHACMVVRNAMEEHPRRRWEAEQRLAAAFDGQQFAFLVDWTGLWNGLSNHDEPNTSRSRLGGIMTDKLERVVTGIIKLIEEDDIYKQEFLKNCPNKLILMVYAEDQTGTQSTTYEFGAAGDTRMTAVDWWAGRYLGSMAAPYAGSLIVSVIENYLTYSPSDPEREIKKLL